MMRLPVWLMPGFIGLKGKTREIAVAEYLFKNEELKRKLNAIENDHDRTSKEYLLRDNYIDREYKVINEKEFLHRKNVLEHEVDSREFKLTELNIEFEEGTLTSQGHKRGTADILFERDTTDHKTAMLDIDLEFEVITDNEYDKAMANINKISWVTAVLHSDKETGQYYFECDWNDIFIAELRSKNYSGVNDEDVIDQWLSRLYATEIYDDVTIGEGAGAQRTPIDDGKAEYK